MIKQKWRICLSLLKNICVEFNNDNAIKLSASLSYYAIFSLPPLLLIVIWALNALFGHVAVSGELFGQIKGLLGNHTAARIQEMLKNVHASTSSSFAPFIGAIVLLIGASGVFSEIQSSINYIWGIRDKPKRGLVNFFKNWLISFSMIGSVGVLLIIGLMVNILMDALDKQLTAYFPSLTLHLFYAMNILIVFLVITVLFAMIFKILPNGKITAKTLLISSLLGSSLFMVGQLLIGLYLSSFNIASVYGVAGSVILLLIWVYYSSAILYFVAEFMKVYTEFQGQEIIPNEYSIGKTKRQ
jgi:membrane protein